MQINKGDVILLFIFVATFLIFGATEYNIINGYEQFDSSAWTAFIAIFGGELLTFALYKIGKAKYLPKTFSDVVDKLEQEKNEEEEEEIEDDSEINE